MAAFDPNVINPALLRLARLSLEKSAFVAPGGLEQAPPADPMAQAPPGGQGMDPMAAQGMDPAAQGMDPTAAGLMTAEGLPETVPGLNPGNASAEAGDEAALFEVVKALNQASAKVMGYLATKRKGVQDQANMAAGLPPASGSPMAPAAPAAPKAAKSYDFGVAFGKQAADEVEDDQSPGDRLGNVAAAMLAWQNGRGL